MELKVCRVFRQVGPTYERIMQYVDVPIEKYSGLDPLTPRVARLAAKAATGKDYGVWVFSTEDRGYALYKNSHRELLREDLERYTIAEWKPEPSR